MEYLTSEAAAAVQSLPEGLAWGKAKVVAEDSGWRLSVAFVLQPAQNFTMAQFSSCVNELKVVVRHAAELYEGSHGSCEITRTVLLTNFVVRVSKANPHISSLSDHTLDVFCADIFTKLVHVWCAQVVRMTVKNMKTVAERFQALGYALDIMMFQFFVNDISDVCISCVRFCMGGMLSLADICKLLQQHMKTNEEIRLRLKHFPPASVKRVSPSSFSCSSSSSSDQSSPTQHLKRVKFATLVQTSYF